MQVYNREPAVLKRRNLSAQITGMLTIELIYLACIGGCRAAFDKTTVILRDCLVRLQNCCSFVKKNQYRTVVTSGVAMGHQYRHVLGPCWLL